jgi:hypothetical protein
VRTIVKSKERGSFDNVSDVILPPGKSSGGEEGQGGMGEEEEGLTEEEKEERKVVKALERKYDAMRDKLIIEVSILRA